MDYRRLGSSGLRVSRIALGCMSFGEISAGFNEWSLGDEDAQPFFQQAIELGITFWDTANVYGFGSSEEIVGRAMRTYTRREDIVLATKLHFKMHDGPGGSGLSRRAVMEQIDASLTRLGTDYVDLYQIHRFDPDTPVEETMEALHDVVKAGKALLHRRLVDVGLAVCQDATRRRPPWLDPVRLHARPIQPDAARGGARDVRPARRPRCGKHPVQPSCQGTVGAAVG
jgi:aryl-alcohol dehydrogenase-like predicted oxidoreductase